MAKFKIDPGHGGHDPGAIGRYSKEKDNVLKVAKRLKTILESHGHTVSLTRSTDIFIPLSERAEQANRWGADYFVSLHDNAGTASSTGFETFIHNGPVKSKTVEFQKSVHDAIIKEIGIKDRGKKRANFAVLRETKMPSVLIEYGFISNVDDERILINEVEKLAQLTVNGIVNYVGGVKVSTPAPSKKKDAELEFSSATLKKEWETFINSKAQREIAVNAAVKAGYSEKWIKGMEEGKATNGDIAMLGLGALIRGNK